ncbi:HAD family phosphatase [Candidatus Woesearchaeota archaeon]|nr:HAD family phosphatase [Candidatus Woesearchaeota archaeon]
MQLDLVIFDLDGTIVRYDGLFQSSWMGLGQALGLEKEWKELTDYYLPRKEIYSEWFTKQVATLRGLEVQPALDKILPPPYALGFMQFNDYLQERGIRRGIVSSGLSLVADYVKGQAGMEVALASELEIEEGFFTGYGLEHVHLHEKGRVVSEVIARLGVNPCRVAYFGDSEHDVPAWNAVSWPFGINLNKESLKDEVAEHFVDFEEALVFFRRQLV